MKRYIVLLRGINVGGHRRIAMADLRALLTRLGYESPLTHLQSGNVVLSSTQSAKQVQQTIERGLAAEFGDGIEVFVRTRKELADVIARDPLGKIADNPSRYFVTFLSGKPAAAAVQAAAAADVGGEQFVVAGPVIYTWSATGLHDSKLAKLLSEKRLGVRATARNWNTVVKLLELADEG
ncbi:MAG: DUF1697 domain-containing protein [Gaiellaceae bacterium]